MARKLATVDELRVAWEESLSRMTGPEIADARRRSLRRHAIETGIIERLYDVGWGVTQALVAEGLTLEVASREGGFDEDALLAINAQFEALEFLAESLREGQGLTTFFIKQLHAPISRHQLTYGATDSLGHVVHAALRHGQWMPRTTTSCARTGACSSTRPRSRWRVRWTA